MINEEIEFAELEHTGGQHKTYQEGCSECYKENRLIQARKVVNIPKVELLERGWAKSIMNKIIWGDNKHFYD